MINLLTKVIKKIILCPGYFIFLLLSFILFTACPEQVDPPEINTTLFLEEEYAGVFETRLYLAAEDSSVELNVSITRDDSVLTELATSSFDTIITDNSVQPGQTYDYQAHWLKGDKILSSSNLVSITTLDTTSHDFIWTVDTLGGPGSNLYDVAVVNENSIWVVGDIETDSGRYNAAHWNGNKWEYVQFLYTGTPPGSNNGSVQEGQTIHSLQSGELFIVAGTTFYWDGILWEELNVPWGVFSGRVNALWGQSPTNLLFVGDNGSLVNYDGTTFSKLSSPTDLPFRDIWGVTHNRTGEKTIIAVASNKIQNPQGKALIRITDNSAVQLDDDGLPDNLNSLWFDSANKYVVGTGVFKYDRDQSIWVEEIEHPSYPYKNAIRGTAINNLAIAGAFGHVSHFNGSTWIHYYEEGIIPSFYGSYKAVSITENSIVAAGWIDNQGVVLRGNKQ